MLLPRTRRPCLLFVDIFNLLKWRYQELLPPLLLATHHPRARLRLYPDQRRGRKCGSALSENACAQPPTLFAQQGVLGDAALPKPPTSKPHPCVSRLLSFKPQHRYGRPSLVVLGLFQTEKNVNKRSTSNVVRPARRPRRCRPT